MSTYHITSEIVRDSLEAGYIIRASSAFVADSSVMVIDVPEAEHERVLAFRLAHRTSEQGNHVVIVDPTLGPLPEWIAENVITVQEAWIDKAPRLRGLSMASRLSRVSDYLLGGSRPCTSCEANPADYEDPRNW